MVKLHFRITRRPNKNGTWVYLSEEVTLNFPKDLHELLRFLRNKKLEIRGYREGKKVHIILGDRENP